MGLAFLTSFENYNTTVVTIQAESTLTTVLAGKVRMGTQPDLAALAVLIIAVTLIGAVAIELAQRRDQRREYAAKAAAARADRAAMAARSEEHTSELQSLMRTAYAVFCLKKTMKQKQ